MAQMAEFTYDDYGGKRVANSNRRAYALVECENVDGGGPAFGALATMTILRGADYHLDYPHVKTDLAIVEQVYGTASASAWLGKYARCRLTPHAHADPTKPAPPEEPVEVTTANTMVKGKQGIQLWATKHQAARALFKRLQPSGVITVPLAGEFDQPLLR